MSLSERRRSQLACLCLLLLLLMLSHLERPCYAHKGKNGIFSNVKGGYSRTEMDTTFKFHGNSEKNGNQKFEDEMRKVKSGPNPLHNR
ncbi:hypothetical protein LIER_27329 [Lithospermum erythrorhizon]|uniref:Clavata3/ESR (CLE) gene family member n=1 Tax=Lithospermum erythrorhizon TaxID=34254 RepID=A0AAV3RBM0_LITER